MSVKIEMSMVVRTCSRTLFAQTKLCERGANEVFGHVENSARHSANHHEKFQMWILLQGCTNKNNEHPLSLWLRSTEHKSYLAKKAVTQVFLCDDVRRARVFQEMMLQCCFFLSWDVLISAV